MRDTDRDRRTHLLVRATGPAELPELRGRVVALGASDSPQATLLPIHHLARSGLQAGRDYAVRRHDVLVGKHGDHVGGERAALQALLAALRERRRGALPEARFLELARAGVRAALDAQLAAGVDIVTDGEQTRDNFYSFVAARLDGVRLMTLAEMLEIVEDKDAFR